MLALTGAIPALIGMWIFDRLDAARPEPRRLLRMVAIAGGLSTIPIGVFQFTIGVEIDGTYPSAALNGFVLAGFIEEAAKLVCVYLVVWRHPHFDERVDGIVYAARAGLGFALVENILYLNSYAGSEGIAILWVGRALLAVPGHAIWAGLMGYFLARRRFDQRGPGALGALLIAALLHGSYDFSLFATPAFTADLGSIAYPIVFGFAIGNIVIGAWILRRLARRALRTDHLEAVSRGSPPAEP